MAFADLRKNRDGPTRRVIGPHIFDRVQNPAQMPQLSARGAEIYKAQVANLETALNDPEIRAEASEALRSLIEKVVLTPDVQSPDGLSAVLHGELATILSLASGPAVGKNASPSGISPDRRCDRRAASFWLAKKLCVDGCSHWISSGLPSALTLGGFLSPQPSSLAMIKPQPKRWGFWRLGNQPNQGRPRGWVRRFSVRV
jgi:hypothetical protein